MANKPLKAAELRGLSGQELRDQIAALKEELFNLNFQKVTGQLASSSRLREVRKDIARIYTVIREREKGIIADPDQKADA